MVGFTLDKTNPADPTLVITFSKDVNESTLTQSSLTLHETDTGAFVGLTVTYDPDRRQATAVPDTPLVPGTRYRFTATTEVREAVKFMLDQNDFIRGSQPFTIEFDTSLPMLTLEGQVSMRGIGDVWMEGSFVYVAARLNGVTIVDATDLTQPIVAATIVDAGFVQGVKVAGGVLFATNEPGGVRLYDVSDPYTPALLSVINDAFTGSAHNVFSSGTLLYVASITSGDIEIYDVGDPAAPAHLGSISNPTGPIHDMTAFGTTAYGAFLPGGFTLADVTDPAAPVTLIDLPYAGAFTHSAWPSAAGTELYTTDEYAGGSLRVWDISDPAAPAQIGTYTAEPLASIHNAQVEGSTVFISYYTQGLRIVDVTDPTTPVEIQFYDTFPGPDTAGVFEGAWGVHAVGDRIAVTDRTNGLFLFRYVP